MRLRKTWSGEIEARGWGLMISGGDPGSGSAGYVAMEMVQGRVGEHSGAFALQQFGTMADGDLHQVYEVVPGSGSEDLTDISGTLAMSVEDGIHHYTLSYDLP